MSQESLFDASEYVRRAHEQLVLAWNRHESAEIASAKWQLLQLWLSLQEARLRSEGTSTALSLDDAFDTPY